LGPWGGEGRKKTEGGGGNPRGGGGPGAAFFAFFFSLFPPRKHPPGGFWEFPRAPEWYSFCPGFFLVFGDFGLFFFGDWGRVSGGLVSPGGRGKKKGDSGAGLNLFIFRNPAGKLEKFFDLVPGGKGELPLRGGGNIFFFYKGGFFPPLTGHEPPWGVRMKTIIFGQRLGEKAFFGRAGWGGAPLCAGGKNPGGHQGRGLLKFTPKPLPGGKTPPKRGGPKSQGRPHGAGGL